MLESLVTLLEDNEPVISAVVGVTTMLAAAWGVIQLFFLSGKSRAIAAAGVASQAATSPDAAAPGVLPRDTSSPVSGSVIVSPESARQSPLRTLLNLGLSSRSELEELVSIRTVNIASLCLMLVNLVWVVTGLISQDMIILMMINGVVFLIALLVLALQASGRVHTAKWLFFFLVTGYWVVIMVVVGGFRGVEYFFPLLVTLPVLLFSKPERKSHYAALLSMVVGFPVAVWIQSQLPSQLPMDEAFFTLAYYINVFLMALTLYAMINFYDTFAASSFHDLELQKSRTDELVNSILPAYVAERVREHESTVADWHSEATVLFATITGFDSLYKRVSAVQLVEMLSDVFTQFDKLTKQYGIDKVNTLGTNYVVATGIGEDGEPAHDAVAVFALEALRVVREFSRRVNHPFSFRAGISTGQVVSGVIGEARPCFDIWGETVELANSMRDTAMNNSIVVNEPAYWRLRERFEFAVTDESEAAYLLLRERQARAVSAESNGSDPE